METNSVSLGTDTSHLQSVLDSGAFDNMIKQYDIQLDKHLRQESPSLVSNNPSTGINTQSNLGLSDQALVRASSDLEHVIKDGHLTPQTSANLVNTVSNTFEESSKQLQKYLDITNKAVHSLSELIHAKSKELALSAHKLDQSHKQKSKFILETHQKSTLQIRQMQKYSKQLSTEIEKFRPTLEQAQSRVEEYSTPSDLQEQANLQQSQLIYSQIHEAISSRMEMNQKVNEWITASSDELERWYTQSVEDLKASDESGKESLEMLKKIIERLQEHYQKAVEMRDHYTVLEKRIAKHSQAINIERRLEQLKNSHQSLVSALRVGYRQASIFTQEEKDLTQKLKTIDDSINEFKDDGDSIGTIESPPEYWSELVGFDISSVTAKPTPTSVTIPESTKVSPVLPTKPLISTSSPREGDSKYPPIPPNFPPVPKLSTFESA